MTKLKNIIKQLAKNDFDSICKSLIESGADKSAYLLVSMRDKSLPDSKIMQELGVNSNAYYTLRSRLKQKIEEYLLQQMENPRTDILKKVANIIEIIFTKKKGIAVATLKKLEKELIDYDLSNELTIVYKSLKKLHVNSPDYFHYSQLYNKHIAYMLAVDKAEDMLAEYFKKYGYYCMNGTEIEKLELELLVKEMKNLSALYDSHRLFVYLSCITIFHRLFVTNEEDDDMEPIEDLQEKIDTTINEYKLDSIYFHIQIVNEFLKHEYYSHYKVFRKAESFYDEINESSSKLLSNYSLFTYPAQFLNSKLERAIRQKTVSELYEENINLYQMYEPDKEDIPKYVTYMNYRSICCYYAEEYDEAARWINSMLNDISLKKFPNALLEAKGILALQYCMKGEHDLFHQLVNSIQRQIRLIGKEKCMQASAFTKILKIAISDNRRDKEVKIRKALEKYPENGASPYNPIKYIVFDEEFFDRIMKVEAAIS
ncbi:hypothetical protein [Aureibacter tunicatorum]|uniref:Uncharacterized protein n=1 Tax=Aureibacter tunicatorum TaxID=866807 RepID=A0AAE3XHQ7_9BACT|nr:hypothetical protein [Aureibacter tunicatorum]MDR6237032.1 hypothetical protein [Aureibacter tunicatorum]BDD06024.1 hypothetical protein AUTU_35070 [Aureibacter tunicatorum]